MKRLIIPCMLLIAAIATSKAATPDAVNQDHPRIIEVAVGEMFHFSLPSHTSIGLESEVIFDKDKLVKQIAKETTYDSPEKMKEGYTGGDSATVKTRYKAMQAGKTKVTVQTLFRGDVQDQRVYVLRVSEPKTDKNKE